MPLLDLTGQKFNYLLVLERDNEYTKINNIKHGVYWKCQCECGEITSVRSDCLRKNIIKSCGCKSKELFRKSQMKDITGQRFGKLIAIEPDYHYSQRVGIKNSGKVIYWKCQCDCGEICYEPGTELRSGKISSCLKCHTSHGEQRIQELLKQHEITFKKNYSFYDLVSPLTNYQLSYDFAIVEQNKIIGLIEFDGEQHFIPIEHFGGKERFKKQQINDRTKNAYALEKQIPLIRIPYTALKQLCYEDLNFRTSRFLITTNDGYCEERFDD